MKGNSKIVVRLTELSLFELCFFTDGCLDLLYISCLSKLLICLIMFNKKRYTENTWREVMFVLPLHESRIVAGYAFDRLSIAIEIHKYILYKNK